MKPTNGRWLNLRPRHFRRQHLAEAGDLFHLQRLGVISSIDSEIAEVNGGFHGLPICLSVCLPGLVNVYITMERSTIFHGKIHYF